MRLLMIVAALGCLAGPALADTCSAQATAKKLHGAAETSFMKKCTADVGGTLGTRATGDFVLERLQRELG